jgi:hypothetical protein
MSFDLLVFSDECGFVVAFRLVLGLVKSMECFEILSFWNTERGRHLVQFATALRRLDSRRGNLAGCSSGDVRIGEAVRVLLCLLLTLPCFGGTAPVLAFEARGREYVTRGLSVSSDGAVFGHSLRMSVVGGSRHSSIEGLDRMPGKANYIPGRSYDLYGRVRWRGVYPGVDVVFRGNLQRLEYDLEIAAGRDPGRIRLTFDGVDRIQVDRNGDLVLSAGAEFDECGYRYRRRYRAL